MFGAAGFACLGAAPADAPRVLPASQDPGAGRAPLLPNPAPESGSRIRLPAPDPGPGSQDRGLCSGLHFLSE